MPTSLERSDVFLKMTACATFAFVLMHAVPLQGQATPGSGPMPEDSRGLLAKAKVTPDSARGIARALLSHATIAEEGIEMEHGKLIYSFDMKTPGRSGIDEIAVDALSGAVLAVKHEGPKQEAAERAQDAKERAAKRDSVRRP